MVKTKASATGTTATGTTAKSGKPRGRPPRSNQPPDGVGGGGNGTTTSTSTTSKKKRPHDVLPTGIDQDGAVLGGPKRGKKTADEPPQPASAPRNPQWDARYEELKAFHREHGHCLVPQRHPPNPPLGTWVRTQRDRKRGHKKNIGRPLSRQEIQDLNDIGFVWELSAATAAQPPQQAAAFAAAAAVPPPPEPKPTKPPKAAAAARRRPHPQDQQQQQRKQHTHHSKGVPWEERYEELCAFQQIFGHCAPSRKEHSQFQVLATWVATQRQRKKGRKGLSSMSMEEVEKLEAIGFEWEPAKKGKMAAAAMAMHEPTSEEEV